MILFGLHKSTIKVEKKIVFILHNFYIKNLRIFLAAPKKGMAAVFIWNEKFKKI